MPLNVLIPSAVGLVMPEATPRLSRRRVTVAWAELTIDGLTVSIGVACYDPGEALDGWIARADKALYAAKAAGRNRVVISAAAA